MAPLIRAQGGFDIGRPGRTHKRHQYGAARRSTVSFCTLDGVVPDLLVEVGQDGLA